MSAEPMGVELLDESACRRLLATTSLGRIGLTVDALPVILPLRFGLVGDDIVARAGDGRELKAATARHVLCFEADGVDEATGDNWTVVVVGQAEILSQESELAAARDLALEPWAPLAEEIYLRIPTGVISGRRAGRVTSRVAQTA